MLNFEEKKQVSLILEELFKIQAKVLDEKTKLLFLNLISNWDFPIEAITTGIKSLYEENLRDIKLATIKSAILSKYQPYEMKKTEKFCEYCGSQWVDSNGRTVETKEGYGTISMIKESTGGSYAFACVCKKGIEYQEYYKEKHNRLIPRWNGQKEQILFGEKYKYFWFDLLEKPAEVFEDETKWGERKDIYG
jgi:hypothetical protein